MRETPWQSTAAEPLLHAGSDPKLGQSDATSTRASTYAFLEARTPGGVVYEAFTVILILTNVVAFVLGTSCLKKYTDGDAAWCTAALDVWLFGNHDNNGLEGSSVLEMCTVVIFTVEYLLRLWSVGEDPKFRGIRGRIAFIFSFFSLVDLTAIVPFYVDQCVSTNLPASQFVRLLRLLRMLRVEGRYIEAFTLFDDVLREQSAILGTASFVGASTWVICASMYYLAEHRSTLAIYCGAAVHCDPEELDVEQCTFDEFGFVDCSKGGCPPTRHNPRPCWNLFESIPSALYFTLLNLFGEFPLIDQHSAAGKVVATLVAVAAVAVFALPVGILANGFEDLLDRRRRQREEYAEAADTASGAAGASPPASSERLSDSTPSGRTSWAPLHAFLQGSTWLGRVFDRIMFALILLSIGCFMLETVSRMPHKARAAMRNFDQFAIWVFTVVFILRVCAAGEEARYAGFTGRLRFLLTFYSLVDILSVGPYWLAAGTTFFSHGTLISPTAVRAALLFRLLKAEKYTEAFTIFDDVLAMSADVLVITGFMAIIMWVMFSTAMYFFERDNPDDAISIFYTDVPNAMWITLLNLSGESPLAFYSLCGKVTSGVVGVFATGFFGIPIGLLGAGFEQWVGEREEDTPDGMWQAVRTSAGAAVKPVSTVGLVRFVDGVSPAGRTFEKAIFALIFITVGLGVLQTVDGYDCEGPDFRREPGLCCSFAAMEWIAVLVFTVEYMLRLVAAGMRDSVRPPVVEVLKFVFSFYSLVDLLAVVPFYLALFSPNSFLARHHQYFRMLRMLRLLKLDKYAPSITLIDDVVRLKRNALLVTSFAAGTLWMIFSGLIYASEHTDIVNALDDPLPAYGCTEECTMSDRFQNFFDSLVYTGVHLTGDYPIVTYSLPARLTCFVMICFSVGVVSVPSSLLAAGFAQIVQSKAKRRAGELNNTGDGYFERKFAALAGVPPPSSKFGPVVDAMQLRVHRFLNGVGVDELGNGPIESNPQLARVRRRRSYLSGAFQILIFSMIVANVVAVMAESIPTVDQYVGNAHGNFFDRFETISVLLFSFEYALRLFSVCKDKQHLYSTRFYATTFFGIVDLVAIGPWYVEQVLEATGCVPPGSDLATVFRIVRIVRILALEHFVTAFTVLDNVFRASSDVLAATGLMAGLIWFGCAACLYLAEKDNSNWRRCDESIPATSWDRHKPGCFDFTSTDECNRRYPGLCQQTAFANMPDSLYYTAVFLGGEWGKIDFTWPGRFVCLFLCVAGIGIYALPVASIFDSFGAVLGLGGDDDDDDDDDESAATTTGSQSR